MVVALLATGAAGCEREASAEVREQAMAPRLAQSATPTSKRSETPTPPTEESPPEAIRAFLDRHPDHPDAAELRRAHDRALLPCPGARARCRPTAELVVDGVLARAAKYAATCLDCDDAAVVERTAKRLALAAPKLRAERARDELDRALEERRIDLAAQVIDDRAPGAGPRFRARATRRLERRRRGELLDRECRGSLDHAILVSPRTPRPGQPARVLVASERAGAGVTVVVESDRRAFETTEVARSDGPPGFVAAGFEVPEAGSYRVLARTGSKTVACQRFAVGRPKPAERGDIQWPALRGWDRGAENLYSAWIGLLFDAREDKHFRGLHEVTRDRDRNLLYDHLGLGEDADGPTGLVLEPDCADHPYFLRAYFAWKLRLPFGLHDCRLGAPDRPARCVDWTTNETPREEARDEDVARDPVRDFRRYLRRLKNDISARSLRTALDDSRSDLFPVPLEREHLRPGVVFSDPYGHTLVLVKWIEQSPDRPGKLLAVDAQPRRQPRHQALLARQLPVHGRSRRRARVQGCFAPSCATRGRSAR